jgi:hypothetical protein
MVKRGGSTKDLMKFGFGNNGRKESSDSNKINSLLKNINSPVVMPTKKM